MYIFSDLLFKSMTVFVDDFSTQFSVNSHLECVREALIRCRMMECEPKMVPTCVVNPLKLLGIGIFYCNCYSKTKKSVDLVFGVL